MIEIERRAIPAFHRLVCHDVVQGTADWHSHRRYSIGSSEAAAVFPGISTTCTQSELFAKLKNPESVAPKQFDDYVLNAMARGREMESVLRDECSMLFGRPIYEAGIFRHTIPELGYALSASPDGLMTDDSGRVVLTEFKWRSIGVSDWAGDLGTTVFCQVQHQMYVIGCETAYVYSGCEGGGRSLWLIQFSPSYFTMWLQWAKKLEDEVKSDLGVKPRSEAGARAQVESFLRLEKRYHVVQLQPSQLKQK